MIFTHGLQCELKPVWIYRPKWHCILLICITCWRCAVHSSMLWANCGSFFPLWLKTRLNVFMLARPLVLTAPPKKARNISHLFLMIRMSNSRVANPRSRGFGKHTCLTGFSRPPRSSLSGAAQTEFAMMQTAKHSKAGHGMDSPHSCNACFFVSDAWQWIPRHSESRKSRKGIRKEIQRREREESKKR